jgi:hypothetical protein
MPGVYSDRNDDGKRFAGGILAVTPGKEWSPRWHSFVEVAGQQLTSRRNGGSVVTLDTGLAFVATPTLQFDVEIARGLSDAAPDFESGGCFHQDLTPLQREKRRAAGAGRRGVPARLTRRVTLQDEQERIPPAHALTRFRAVPQDRLSMPLPRLSILSLACAAGFVANTSAFAAADDQPAQSTPVATSGGFVATTRRLIDDTLEKERAVVAVLRENVVSRVMATSWRLSLRAPYVTRATAIVSHGPVPNDFADAGSAPISDEDAIDLSLGARWRVVHGDANSHVPSAAWMPDLQAADAHNAALRPTMNLSGEWTLPNDFSLGVMPGMAVDYSVQGRRQSTGTLAVTLGKTWSPQWRTFVDMARDRMGTPQVAGASTSVDAGVSFAAAPGTSIDFAVTHGLSDTAAPFQAGLGVSSRF